MYSLVVLDALYKALPVDVDENSNGNITQMYIMLDETAEKHDCAAVVVHHTSKGAQHQKSVSDMGSGAGAQSRSADCHMVLRDHEDKDTVTLQAIIRSQKPIAPCCITFEYPLWKPAPDKNPSNVAVANKKPTPTLDEFLATIPFEPGRKNGVLAVSKARLGISKSTQEALLESAIARNLIEVVQPANKRLPHTIRRLADAPSLVSETKGKKCKKSGDHSNEAISL
jgi:hypothetical protein